MTRLLFLCACLCVTLTSFSQIVNIPDANFKDALLNHDPVIDTNNDGEIQVSEAEATSELVLFSTNIVNTTGLESFINLTSLNTKFNDFTSIDISELINLTTVIFYDLELNSLSFTSNTLLELI